jgi:hypothetical protein
MCAGGSQSFRMLSIERLEHLDRVHLETELAKRARGVAAMRAGLDHRRLREKEIFQRHHFHAVRLHPVRAERRERRNDRARPLDVLDVKPLQSIHLMPSDSAQSTLFIRCETETATAARSRAEQCCVFSIDAVASVLVSAA